MQINNHITTIAFNDTIYPEIQNSIQSFRIIEDIFSLYPSAVCTVSLTEDFFTNEVIFVGTKVTIAISIIEKNTTIMYDFLLWKLQTGSEGGFGNSLTKTYTFTLIHPFYFHQKIKSKAYIGKGDTIFYSALLYNDLLAEFSKLDITPAYPQNIKVYQLRESFGSFIENTLQQNYIIDNSPVFMYTTLDNVFHINSFKKLIDSTEYGIACNVNTTKIAKKDITSAYEKNKLHNVLNTSYSINESGTLWKKIKAKTITLQTFNQTKKEDTLNANNSLFSNTSGFYPIHKDFKNITDTLMVYINDSQQNPVSILASYLNEQVSILGDNVVTTTGDVALNIHVGDKMLLEVTKNALSQFPEISEITNPYIIMANELIYQKNTLTQVVTYARDMISSTIKTNI